MKNHGNTMHSHAPLSVIAAAAMIIAVAADYCMTLPT